MILCFTRCFKLVDTISLMVNPQKPWFANVLLMTTDSYEASKTKEQSNKFCKIQYKSASQSLNLLHFLKLFFKLLDRPWVASWQARWFSGWLKQPRAESHIDFNKILINWKEIALKQPRADSHGFQPASRPARVCLWLAVWMIDSFAAASLHPASQPASQPLRVSLRR